MADICVNHGLHDNGRRLPLAARLNVESVCLTVGSLIIVSNNYAICHHAL